VIKINTSRIETRRRELNIPRKVIYTKLGICAKTYYHYINGKAIPSDMVLRLADILKCSSDYLLGKKDYTNITVIDNTGAVLANISQSEIVEHDSVKVILS